MKYKHFLFLSIFFILQATFAQEEIVYDVKIKGNKKTKTKFLKKILKTKNGTVLDSIQLKKDIISLKRLSPIGHAYFQVFHSHDNFYNVFIYVEENFTIIPDVNLWTAANDVFAYKLGLYEYNFLGRNIAIGGFYQDNGFVSYALNFKAPNLFSRKWGLEVNFQDWKSKEPVFFPDRSINYLYNNVSTEVLGLYQINFNNKLSFGVNVFSERFSIVQEENIDDTIDRPEPDANKRLFKVVYEYDNLDYYYQYISGFKSTFYGQYVTTDNEFQETFLIGWNDFFYYKRVGKRGNWANRLRIGLATNNDSPFAPFALDNKENIRGVGIIVDRGTGSIILNSEYRYTLYDNKKFIVQSNAFLDGGTWRTPGGSFNDFTNGDDMELFTGLGLRFISKKIHNATFRIDYGVSLTDNKNGLVFGLGQYF